MKKTPALAAAALAAGVALFFFLARRGGEKDAAIVRLVSEAVSRGDVVSTVAASGTIEPDELVDVGSQVTGEIVAFGTDASGAEVDYCSIVTNGMVLARIDDVTYLADLDVARAQHANALAAVSAAKASLRKAEVDAAHAAKDFARARAVGVGIALSQSDWDASEAAAESAEAQVGVAAAAVKQAEAQVVQTRANVEKAERNLGYCTIASPVDGVVVDRRVNLGQTVVSSMSVSSLFLVAKDLRKMRIWASVNEADVGSVKAGQNVSFTVDAFPERVFRGVVRRVRLNATLSSNVVTYTVEIDVDNADLTLLPYLTASVEFETKAERGALVVPSRALRWSPEGAAPPPAPEGARTVWVDSGDGAPPRPVPVRVLLDNGTGAAVEPLRAGDLAEGARVVVRAEAVQPAAAKSAAKGSNNPLLPKMPKPPRRNNGGGGPR